jgi:hypothetical protein
MAALWQLIDKRLYWWECRLQYLYAYLFAGLSCRHRFAESTQSSLRKQNWASKISNNSWQQKRRQWFKISCITLKKSKGIADILRLRLWCLKHAYTFKHQSQLFEQCFCTSFWMKLKVVYIWPMQENLVWDPIHLLKVYYLYMFQSWSEEMETITGYVVLTEILL